MISSLRPTDDSGRDANFFYDYFFSCNGQLVGWTWYAQSVTTAFADVMRRTNPDNVTSLLVKKTTLQSTSVGEQTQILDSTNWFNVKAGDFIATHHTSGNSLPMFMYGAQMHGYDQLGYKRVTDLSIFSSKAIHDASFGSGSTFTIPLQGYRRTVALTPHIIPGKFNNVNIIEHTGIISPEAV